MSASIGGATGRLPVCFVALFVLSGLGNGSVYKMILTILRRAAASIQ